MYLLRLIRAETAKCISGTGVQVECGQGFGSRHAFLVRSWCKASMGHESWIKIGFVFVFGASLVQVSKWWVQVSICISGEGNGVMWKYKFAYIIYRWNITAQAVKFANRRCINVRSAPRMDVDGMACLIALVHEHLISHDILWREWASYRRHNAEWDIDRWSEVEVNHVCF